MATLFHTTDDDFDRIYTFLYKRSGAEIADRFTRLIREDAEAVGQAPFARRDGFNFHRGRNGYFLFFEFFEGEANIYAIFHERERYADVVADRAEEFWQEFE
ncbi:hypothetical protein JL39_25720 [Rhizobium sp. YS-1r]|nr:hypothetical protein JL39_25720 [Rhizobium sp. YS-1r]